MGFDFFLEESIITELMSLLMKNGLVWLAALFYVFNGKQ